MEIASMVWCLDSSSNTIDPFSTPFQGTTWYPAIIDSTMKTVATEEVRFNIYTFNKLFTTEEEREETRELKTLVSRHQLFPFFLEHNLLLQYFATPFPIQWQQFHFNTSAQFVYTYIQYLLCNDFESSLSRPMVNLTSINTQHYICKCIPMNRKLQVTCFTPNQQIHIFSTLLKQAQITPLTIYFVGNDSQEKVRFFHQFFSLLCASHGEWNRKVHIALDILSHFTTVLLNQRQVFRFPFEIAFHFSHNDTLSQIKLSHCHLPCFDTNVMWKQLPIFYLLLQNDENSFINCRLFESFEPQYKLVIDSLDQFIDWCTHIDMSMEQINMLLDRCKACLLLLEMKTMQKNQMELLHKWSHLEKGVILSLIKQHGLKFMNHCFEIIYEAILTDVVLHINSLFSNNANQEEEENTRIVKCLYIPCAVDTSKEVENDATVLLCNELNDYLIHHLFTKSKEEYQFPSNLLSKMYSQFGTVSYSIASSRDVLKTIFVTQWIPFCCQHRTNYYSMHCHNFEARNPLSVKQFHILMRSFSKLGLLHLIQHVNEETEYPLLHDIVKYDNQLLDLTQDNEMLPERRESEIIQQLVELYDLSTHRNVLQTQLYYSSHANAFPNTMNSYFQLFFEKDSSESKLIVPIQYIKLVLYFTCNLKGMEWNDLSWEIFAQPLKELKRKEHSLYESLTKECLFVIYYIISNQKVLIPLLHSQQIYDLLIGVYCVTCQEKIQITECIPLLRHCILELSQFNSPKMLQYLIHSNQILHLLLWNEQFASFDELWKLIWTHCKQEWKQLSFEKQSMVWEQVLESIKSFVYFVSGMEKQELYSLEKDDDISEEEDSTIETNALLTFLMDRQQQTNKLLSESLLQLTKLSLHSTMIPMMCTWISSYSEEEDVTILKQNMDWIFKSNETEFLELLMTSPLFSNTICKQISHSYQANTLLSCQYWISCLLCIYFGIEIVTWKSTPLKQYPLKQATKLLQTQLRSKEFWSQLITTHLQTLTSATLSEWITKQLPQLISLY